MSNYNKSFSLCIGVAVLFFVVVNVHGQTALPPFTVSNITMTDITPRGATFRWETNFFATCTVSIALDEKRERDVGGQNGVLLQSTPVETGTTHLYEARWTNLNQATRYYALLRCKDPDWQGDTQRSFMTLAADSFKIFDVTLDKKDTSGKSVENVRSFGIAFNMPAKNIKISIRKKDTNELFHTEDISSSTTSLYVSPANWGEKRLEPRTTYTYSIDARAAIETAGTSTAGHVGEFTTSDIVTFPLTSPAAVNMQIVSYEADTATMKITSGYAFTEAGVFYDTTARVRTNNGFFASIKREKAANNTLELQLRNLEPDMDYSLKPFIVIDNILYYGSVNTVRTKARSDIERVVVTNLFVRDITATSAVITWSTNVPVETHLQSGKTSPKSDSTVLGSAELETHDGAPKILHSVLLNNLVPNTVYYYRVAYFELGRSTRTAGEIKTFTTSNVPLTTSPTPLSQTTTPSEQQIAVVHVGMQEAIKNFITYGVDENTKKLGSGERAAVINSFKAAFAKLPETEAEFSDAMKIANGRFPSQKSADAEAKAQEHFRKIYKRDPMSNNPNDTAAITVMAYGLRQKAENRNLHSERAGIITFSRIYGKAPTTTEEWNIMQAITYSGATRKLRDVDSDSDGLSDKREKELGTDSTNPDTDGDGYKDGQEVANGYDPLKPPSGE